MKALIIEDDGPTAGIMGCHLKAAGFTNEFTDLGEDGVDLAKVYDFDLITLDLNLPDIHGLEVLRRIRTAKVMTPVLIVTGEQSIETKVKTLGAGADDFLAKPFHKDELAARALALVRRSKGHAEAVVRAGPLAVHMDRKEVTVHGKPVHLTGKEYQLLELLALRKGQTLTKEAFLNHLYGGMDEPEIKIIDVFICKLRKKLIDAGADGIVHTVWGRGYALHDNAPVHGQPKPEAILGLIAGEPKTFEALQASLRVTSFALRSTLAVMRADHLIRSEDGRSGGVYEITGRGRERLRALSGEVAA